MIEKLQACHKTEYVNMVKEFYSTDAVMKPIPEKYILDTFDFLLTDNAYADCLIAVRNGVVAGYMLLAKTWSQEGGGICVWVDELFVKSDFRGCGIGKEFMLFLDENYPCARLRLEVEEYNVSAVGLYKKFGFDYIPYKSMIVEKRKV